MQVHSEDKFTAIIRVGVGPIRTDFKFKIDICEKKAPSHVRLRAVGSGSGSRVELDLGIDLQEASAGSEISYKSDTRVSGIMASLGQGLIRGTAEKTVADIFECIRNTLG